MKRLIFYLSFLLIYMSCSDDKSEPFSKDGLINTIWQGYIEIENQENIKYLIEISFDSPTNGFYQLLDAVNNFEQTCVFKYNIEDKQMIIRGGYKNILEGNWIIIRYTGKTIDIRKRTGSINMSTLKLHLF